MELKVLEDLNLPVQAGITGGVIQHNRAATLSGGIL
jgi:hypothetical protein